MVPRPLVAFDIGATKVACAIGTPREAAPGVELLGTSLVPSPVLSDGWLDDPLTVGRTIEEALEATGVSGDFHRAVIAFSHPALASERVRATAVLGDEPVTIRRQDLTRLQVCALNQVLAVDREPLAVERLACEGNGFEGVQDPVGLTATRLAGVFHVVTMPMAARRALVQAVESAGLEVAELVFSLQASAAGLADGGPRRLVVDIGGPRTDVGLFVDGRLRALRTLPWGGLSFAMAVARSCRATVEQAVTLSLEGLGSRTPAVRELLEHGLRGLQAAVQQLTKGEPLPEGLSLVGRGALIDGVAEWCEEATGIPATIARSPRLPAGGDLARQVGMGAAIGLLEFVTQTPPARALVRGSGLFDRVIDRTRAVLTEYF
jgi:cell division protein FtsA